MGDELKEVTVVIFHAALLGRTDIIKNALSSLRDSKHSAQEIAQIISSRRPEDKATPLHVAAAYGHSDVIRALVNAGADLSVRSSSGEYAGLRPFEAASDLTKQIFVVILFEQIALGNLEALTRLLDGGLPVDAKDGTQDSTLHWAVSFNKLEVARLLIARGCDVNLRNAAGQSVLQLAVQKQLLDLVQLLLDEGAEVDPADSDAITSDEVRALLAHPPPPSLHLRAQHQASLALLTASEDVDTGGEPVSSDAGSVSDVSDAAPTKRLVFWPPVQQQAHDPAAAPLQLRSDENLLVCVVNNEVDIFPVLSASGFLDCMDVYGFQVQVKRTAMGAKVRLVVDVNVCPLRHSYQLTCTHDQLLLVAADLSGLLYGMYTLIQVIQLHSTIGLKHNVAHVAIPALRILDFPQTPQRAVLWSFRQEARLQAQPMRETVELLSKLRINMLLLVVDPVQLDATASSLPSAEGTSTKVYALDEECRRRCVELVPTVIINHTDERLPLDLLKNFSHSMITLVLNLSEGIDESDYTERCRQTVKMLLKDAQLAGFSTVQISCSTWTKRVANPLEIAHSIGITVVEREMGSFYPTTLFSKPVVCTQDFVQTMAAYVKHAQAATSMCTVFPAHMERDFWFPSLILKYYLFVYAALSWNASAYEEMMGDAQVRAFYCPLLKELLCLTVFPEHRAAPKSAMQTLLLLLSADWAQLCETLGMQDVAGSPRTGALASASFSSALPAEVLSAADLCRTERMLWTVASMPSTAIAHSYSLAMDSLQLGQSMRIYRRLLQMAEWRAHGFSDRQQLHADSSRSLLTFLGVTNGPEGAAGDGNGKLVGSTLCVGLEELWVTLNLLATACKVLLQAHAAHKKLVKQLATGVPIAAMLNALPVGMRSDVANGLLEALTGFTLVWRKRFERRLMDALREGAEASSASNAEDDGAVCRELHVSLGNQRYLLQSVPSLPMIYIFQLLTDGLPAPRSLISYLERIFG